MKDKKDKPPFDPDLWKKYRDKNSDLFPDSLGKLRIPEKPEAKVSYDPESGRFSLEGSDADKSREEAKSGESNLGCGLLFLIPWTAWTIYVVWPIVVSFTEMGYELALKLTWILVAWVAPMVLFFMPGRSE